MKVNTPMENGDFRDPDARLDELFRAYNSSFSQSDAGADFMPHMWAKIEARQASSNWFGNLARGLVTAALAASVILGLIVSSMNQSPAFFNDTYVGALIKDNTAQLEPLHLDRISELEMERQ
jgi:hypothetical protein